MLLKQVYFLFADYVKENRLFGIISRIYITSTDLLTIVSVLNTSEDLTNFDLTPLYIQTNFNKTIKAASLIIKLT